MSSRLIGCLNSYGLELHQSKNLSKLQLFSNLDIHKFYHRYRLHLVSHITMLYIYIYIYIYHAMTDACTTALLPKKPSSDDNSWFRHGFKTEPSLPLSQSTVVVTHYTTRLFGIVVALWDCHIHADAVRAVSWILFYVFLLVWWEKSKISQECRGWVGDSISAYDLDRRYIGFPAISVLPCRLRL